VNIKFLETFLAVVRFRNFRLAAEAHNISQAAVSNRIAALEEELNCRLFDRTHRELPLTDEGNRLISHANSVIKAYELLKRDISGDAPFRGAIRIGTVSTFASEIIPHVSKSVLLAMPGLRLSLYTAETLELINTLRDGRLDLAIGRAGHTPPNCTAVPLCTFKMFWVGTQQVPGETDCPLTPEQLATMRLISYSPASPYHQFILDYLGINDTSKLTISHSDSLATMISFLKNGLGVAPIPAIAVRDELMSGELKILPAQDPLPDAQYALFIRGNTDTPAVRAITALIREETETFCSSLPDKYAIFIP